MAMTATAETANVAALRRIAVAGSASASTTAPSAGPATTAPCPIAARSALARCSSSSATSRAVLAATEGEVTVLAAVASAASTGASTIGSPAAATSARPAMGAIGAHHQPPAVVSVGQDTAHRSEHDDRQDAGGRGERHPRGRAGTAEDEGQQSDVVEPVAQRRGGESQQDEVEGAATRKAAAMGV
jgi:hypothetical protein